MLELLFGLVVLVLDIWAIINVVRSTASTLEKALWVVGILVLPVIGFIAWLLLGPRAAVRGPAP
ncbi:MAG: PLD nuclease N-terminal domain-containing protein [Pseudomonadota bacterium]